MLKSIWKRVAVVACLALACLSGQADGRQAEAEGVLTIKVVGVIRDAETGKVLALVVVKRFERGFRIDTRSTNYIDYGMGHRFAGEFLDDSSKKSKLTPGSSDLSNINSNYWDLSGLMISARGKKKRKLDAAQPLTVTSVDPKGKIKYVKGFSQARMNLKYKFEGDITDGEFKGHKFKGSMKLKFKGDRL